MGKVLTNIVFPFVLGVSLIFGCEGKPKTPHEQLILNGTYESITPISKGIWVGENDEGQRLIHKNGEWLHPIYSDQDIKITQDGLYKFSRGICNFYFSIKKRTKEELKLN